MLRSNPNLTPSKSRRQAIAFIVMERGCLFDQRKDFCDAKFWTAMNTLPYKAYFKDLSQTLVDMDDEAAFAYWGEIQFSHAPLLGNDELRAEQAQVNCGQFGEYVRVDERVQHSRQNRLLFEQCRDRGPGEHFWTFDLERFAEDQQRDFVDRELYHQWGSVALDCPGNHGLRAFQPQQRGFSCDVCGSGVTAGATMHGCRVCNFDACASCGDVRVRVKVFDFSATDAWMRVANAAKPKSPAAATAASMRALRNFVALEAYGGGHGDKAAYHTELAAAHRFEEECLASDTDRVALEAEPGAPAINDFGAFFEESFKLSERARRDHSAQLFCVQHPVRPRNRYTDCHRFNINMMSEQQLMNNVPGIGAFALPN